MFRYVAGLAVFVRLVTGHWSGATGQWAGPWDAGGWSRQAGMSVFGDVPRVGRGAIHVVTGHRSRAIGPSEAGGWCRRHMWASCESGVRGECNAGLPRARWDGMLSFAIASLPLQ